MRKDEGKDNDYILITGATGFIGFHLSKRLLEQQIGIVGIDNMNDYYDVKLKQTRLNILLQNSNFTFIEADIADKQNLDIIMKKFRPRIVINLAAQAGVRYSITNPDSYLHSNIIGFFNVLECCRHNPVEHLIFASSSSVYGLNETTPFNTDDKIDKPASLYAATKASNELMAYSYSHLYHIPTTGLRFFTVYGPYGRPDMAYFSFSDAIMEGRSINIYNNGDMYRDFTFVEDVVECIERLIFQPPKVDIAGALYKIYNIGNNQPVKLMDFISLLEKHLGKEAKKEYLPMQDGDVYRTYADISDTTENIGYKPTTSIEEGVIAFVSWYKDYRNKYHLK